MKKAIALALVVGLGGCAPLVRFPSLPKFDKSAPSPTIQGTAPLKPITPVSCPADLMLDLQDQPKWPQGSALPQVVDTDPPELKDGFPLYLQGLHDKAGWGAEGWRRAGIARTFCQGLIAH